MSNISIIKTTAGIFGAIVFGTVLLAGTSSYYSVDEGQRAIVLRGGAYSHEADAGLHFKLPFFDEAKFISTREYNFPFDLKPYSSDSQRADLRINVNVRADPAQIRKLYTDYGTLDNAVNRIVSKRVIEAANASFGRMSSGDIIKDRDSLTTAIRTSLERTITNRDPILVTSVQVENLTFSGAYDEAAEARALAVIGVQTREQLHQQELKQKEIDITKAEAIAESAVKQAEATAKRIDLESIATANATKRQGEADAAAIAAKGKAQRDNPGLTELVKAERWNGTLPTTMLPNSSVPMINLKGE